MAIYTFTTPEIDDALVTPVAIQLGYKTKIKSVESFSNQTSIPELAENVKNYTQMDGGVLYSFDITTEVDNTETIESFMQDYFRFFFLREKILPAIVEVQTSGIKAEKEAKELELEQAKKVTEEYLISNS